MFDTFQCLIGVFLAFLFDFFSYGASIFSPKLHFLNTCYSLKPYTPGRLQTTFRGQADICSKPAHAQLLAVRTTPRSWTPSEILNPPSGYSQVWVEQAAFEIGKWEPNLVTSKNLRDITNYTRPLPIMLRTFAIFVKVNVIREIGVNAFAYPRSFSV